MAEIQTGSKGLVSGTQGLGPAPRPVLDRGVSDGGVYQSRMNAARSLGSLGSALSNLGDAGESRQSSSSEDVVQNRFGLIIGGVTGGDVASPKLFGG